ncbi:hypothetical protein ACFFX1_33470 [Dactylosporangium sucinum]|uniref:Uncharacterized protein n=1 Tax=Dactylosporangium sucinum TaxID=1424081 RepID=A0A917TR83_9ACTN|nr:hypothetical protein [Dactylosporangium sucinum]GGM33326.1 hypothetical protein GCM10007977_038450 [Dactylosporangium sucinum]
MRISALSGASLLVLGLAGLAGALYYDQAHAAEWTTYAEHANAINGPAEALTAQVFTLIGAIAAGFGAVISGGSAILAAVGGRIGHWMLRVAAVLILVLLLLVAAALAVGALTGDEPAAIIDTPGWLLTAEIGALMVAVLGAGMTTVNLWRFTPAEDSAEEHYA